MAQGKSLTTYRLIPNNAATKSGSSTPLSSKPGTEQVQVSVPSISYPYKPRPKEQSQDIFPKHHPKRLHL